MNVAPDGGKDGAGCWHRVIAGRLAPGSSLQVPNIKLSEAWEQGLPVPLLLVCLPGKLPPLRTRHGPAFVCGVTPATRCSAQRAGMGQPHLMPPRLSVITRPPAQAALPAAVVLCLTGIPEPDGGSWLMSPTAASHQRGTATLSLLREAPEVQDACREEEFARVRGTLFKGFLRKSLSHTARTPHWISVHHPLLRYAEPDVR